MKYKIIIVQVYNIKLGAEVIFTDLFEINNQRHDCMIVANENKYS